MVTFDDGTKTETQATVTHLPPTPATSKPSKAKIDNGQQSKSPTFENNKNNGLSIQEIGQDTFKREIMKSAKSEIIDRKIIENNDTINDSVDENVAKVRVVPIKLLDGKVIQQSSNEPLEMKSEFTNFSHQEFSDDEPHIPRLDQPGAGEAGTKNSDSQG